jgi:hypothetical protein
VRRISGSSIRVSPSTLKRVADLSVRLKASPDEVIDRALDKLEHGLFWKGFEEEAQAYLAAYPMERQERDRYAGI